MEKQNNGKAMTVPKGTKPDVIIDKAADVFEEAKKEGKNYFSRLVVIREEETGKVYLAKAFKDRIGLFTEQVHLPLETKVTRGKVAKS